MPLALLQTACQCLHFLVTGVAMSMFRELADQVSFLIVAAILRRMLMLLQLTIQLFRHCIAAVVVVMALTLLLAADQHLFITAVSMLMLLYPA